MVGAADDDAMHDLSAYEGEEFEKVVAPFPASVWEVTCAVDDEVAAGQQLCVLEAMKMETPVATVYGGKLVAVVVQKDALVARGQVLAVLKKA